MATPEYDDMAQMIAAGVAGYAVAMELMSKLEERGLLSRNEGAGIIDAALVALERSDERSPHEAFRIARRVLDAQLKRWQQDRPG